MSKEFIEAAQSAQDVDRGIDDSARLPVVGFSWLDTAHFRRKIPTLCVVAHWHALCRLTDAQSLATDLRLELNAKRLKLCAALKERNDAKSRLAEKNARIAQLAAHARGKNKALANALKEIERLKRTIETGLDNELALVGERTELRAQLQSAPAERGVVRQETNFVASTGEGRNPLYEGQFDDETPEQADRRLHWSRTAMEVQSARLNPAPATADSDVPGITVEHEDDATVEAFGGIVESCHFCQAPTRYWHAGTNNPVCPDCAKKHRVEELPNWLADSDVREVK